MKIKENEMEVTKDNNPMSHQYGMNLRYPTNLFDRDVQEALINDHFNGTTTAYDLQYKKLNELGNPASAQQGQPSNNTQQPTASGFADNKEYEEYKRLKSMKDAQDLENVLNTVFGQPQAGYQQQSQVPAQTPVQPQTPAQAGQQGSDLFEDLFGTGTVPQQPAQQPQENANINTQTPQQDYNALAQKEVFKAALTKGVDPTGFYKFMSGLSMDDFVELYKAVNNQNNGQQQTHQPQQTPQQHADLNPINLANIPGQRNVQYEQPYMRTGGKLTGTLFE